MLAVAVLFVVALFLAVLSQAFVSAQSVAWAVVLFGPILLLTVYIHELGHCLASRKVTSRNDCVYQTNQSHFCTIYQGFTTRHGCVTKIQFSAGGC